MATFGPHGLVIPEYLNSANGPDAFQRFAQSIEGGLYGVAVDEADRDTRFADIPAGGLVTSHERRAVWMRTETGWTTMAGERIITSGASERNGFTLDLFEAVIERDRTVQLTLQMSNGGSKRDAPGNGNITNTEIATLPVDVRPGRSVAAAFRATATSGGVQIHPNGDVLICDMHPSSVIDVDQYVHIDATYRLAGA